MRMNLNFPWKKKSQQRMGMVLSTHSLTWALFAPGPEATLLRTGAVLLNGQELSDTLDVLQKEVEIKDVEVHLVLPVGTYQFLLTDAPAVQETELVSALRWKIGDLLNYDAAEAVLDAFLLPEDAYRGRQRMTYVAACPKAQISSYEQSFHRAGMSLQRISIPEITGFHLSQRLAEDGEALATAFIGVQETHLCLLHNNLLYLARQAPLGWARLRNPDDFDQLVLEIQRSLDYFDSQIGKGTIRRVLISPHIKADELAAHLDQNLTPSVAVMQLPEAYREHLGGSAADETLAVGAALGAML